MKGRIKINVWKEAKSCDEDQEKDYGKSEENTFNM